MKNCTAAAAPPFENFKFQTSLLPSDMPGFSEILTPASAIITILKRLHVRKVVS